MSIVRAVSILSALSLFGTGCVLSEEPASPEPATGQVQQSSAKCPIWSCGANSPVIDQQGFHELNEDGIAESESGFRIVSFVTATNVSMHVDVVQGQLTGVLSNGNRVVGSALVGSILRVVSPTGLYAIKIAEVGSVPYWAKNGFNYSIETYLFDWAKITNGTIGRYANVCSNPDTREPTLGMNQYHTVVFEGDRVDGRVKRDTGVDTTGKWFNFGCAGHALAKMYLTGHVEAARYAGFTTSLAERTTILKMFSADYCGDGEPYTVTGTPLDWADDHGWMTFGQFNLLPVSIEARWSVGGAACLSTRRLDAHPQASEATYFPNGVLWAMQQNPSCATVLSTPCSDSNWNDQLGYHLVTANPP